MTPIRDLLTPIVSRALDRRQQLELFGESGRSGLPARIGRAGNREGGRCDDAHQAPAADICDDPDQGQGRHHSPQVGRGPVQATGLAQALGNPPAPFDFQAAIDADPRAVPQDDRPVPAFLRLATDDLPQEETTRPRDLLAPPDGRTRHALKVGQSTVTPGRAKGR